MEFLNNTKSRTARRSGNAPAGKRVLAAAALQAGLAAGLAALASCSSAPVKMECQELQARIDYGNLTGDQLRFAQDELEDCRGRAKDADAKDSALIEGTERRFTPSDSVNSPAPATK